MQITIHAFLSNDKHCINPAYLKGLNAYSRISEEYVHRLIDRAQEI